MPRKKTAHQLDLDIARALASSPTKLTPATIKNEPIIMVREDAKKTWRQYMVITNQRVAIVEMLPAILGGWNFHRETIQGKDDWPNMTRDQIVAYKVTHNTDDLTKLVTNLDPTFRAKLLARAGL